MLNIVKDGIGAHPDYHHALICTAMKMVPFTPEVQDSVSKNTPSFTKRFERLESFAVRSLEDLLRALNCVKKANLGSKVALIPNTAVDNTVSIRFKSDGIIVIHPWWAGTKEVFRMSNSVVELPTDSALVRIGKLLIADTSLISSSECSIVQDPEIKGNEILKLICQSDINEPLAIIPTAMIKNCTSFTDDWQRLHASQ